jgi:hypothetical protein
VRLPATGLRCCAYAILGLAPDRRFDAVLASLVEPLDSAWHASATSRWCWLEDRLTYDNARLLQAMLVAADALGQPQTAGRALASLDWYLTQVGLNAGLLRCVGNRWRHRRHVTRDRDDGDEQPIDAGALVEALVAAYAYTGEDHYARLAKRAFAWFLGRNRHATPLYDTRTGGCHDGLTAHGVNHNQGAESTLAYHQALMALAGAGLVRVESPAADTALEELPCTR